MPHPRALVLGLAATLLAAASVSAQDAYPSKVVRLVVPFAAGGSTDLLARSLAERLTDTWKQSMIVDNRPGGGGVIGSDAVAKSRPDGYTLLLGTATTHAVAQTLYPKLPYHVERDFTPIAELVTIPQLLSVHPSMPVHTVQELVAYAAAKPGEVSYGGGPGTTPAMSMAMLTSRAGVKMLEVPYQGSGPSMIALIGGHLNATFDVLMTTLPHLQAGKVRALAVTSARRNPLLPNIPTVAESGYPGFESSVWFGLFAPAGTPPEIIRKIGEDTRKVLNEPKYREKLESAGFEIVASTPGAFAVRVKEDVQKWRKVIIDANIKID
jgi:tripartite-type tricarboxylate transporter receptor subunit TctC